MPTYGKQTSAGGGTVTTDSTLTGAGTGASPLGINPVAARAPDSAGYFKAYFQQKTGLSPLLYASHFEDFLDGNRALTGSNGYGFQASGTGTNVAFAAGLTGVITMTGATSGAGFSDWSLAASGAQVQIPNARTKRWLLAYRVACAHAPVAASRVSMGLFIGGATVMGIGYSSAATNWKYCRGSGTPTELADTGTAIDSTGTVFIWMYLFNDGTNVKYCVDVSGSGVETTAEVSSNVPSSTAMPYLWNEGNGASDIIKFDAFAFCCER